MAPSIAIVGMACRFPGAHSITEFWENILAQRRAFRRIPPERLRLDDYFAEDRAAEDRIYSKQAALIEGWQFPREKFRVSGEAYRSSDLAHWLALDVASDALADAGFADGHGLPKQSTGVFLGNTLTGEFSRANVLRLRWPYVRRVLESSLAERDWSEDERRAFLERMEAKYKAPFPPTGDETLAGSLSNTIAGRICNYYDLNGGGYTVDGACASSLLSITNACSALTSGDVDAAIAGGVDLSIDPFELIGFAKAGALASDAMRVYDSRSDGFIPGEGCGLFVMMRYADAVAAGSRIYAVIPGWGISSDGSGGLTRPEADGQLLAIERAWRRAELSIATAAYLEGHGTGTTVGDATELTALSHARKRAGASAPAAIGSVKALIGHCKAAAGAAGLIKAALVVHNRVLPPTAGCEQPHQLVSGEKAELRILKEGERWPDEEPLHAAVSAMGFGGINAHVVLQEAALRQPVSFETVNRNLRSTQDAELFIFSGDSKEELIEKVDALALLASGFSMSDLTDAAAECARQARLGKVRAAIVASTSEQLDAGLSNLRDVLAKGAACVPGVHFNEGAHVHRIGFLFPGQGSPTNIDGGLWRRRFANVAELYANGQMRHVSSSGVATEIVQPAVVRNTIAALRVIGKIGVIADVAVGHSLGELSALHWAGALSEEDLQRLVERRSAAMSCPEIPQGSMAAISADYRTVASLINGEQVKIAGINSPMQTVISGAVGEIDKVLARVRSQRIPATPIAVSHAFHSSLMDGAAQIFINDLSAFRFKKVVRNVYSTVTGAALNGADLRELLARQITAPVRFMEAVQAAGDVDLWIECGPGAVLSRLVREIGAAKVCSLDTGGQSVRGLLDAVGAAFVLGAPVSPEKLFEDRLTRPIRLDQKQRFFVNPCELAPAGEATPIRVTIPVSGESLTDVNEAQSVIETLRRIVAERSELPISAVTNRSRMLSDLHLNSIVVGRIVSDTCRVVGLPAPQALTEFADGSLEAIAEAVEELKRNGGSSRNEDRHPAGVGTWVRAFRPNRVEKPLVLRKAVFDGDWHLITADNDSRRNDVLQALHRAGGGGVALCLPDEIDESSVLLILRAASTVLSGKFARRFVLIQGQHGAASFARTMHLEVPQLTTRVLCIPAWSESTKDWIAEEIAAADSGFVEVHCDDSGRRFESAFETVHLTQQGTLNLTSEDLILITGGGKGIAAECGFALARKTGVRLALMGRSLPEDDEELAANLERIRSVAQVVYVSADVNDKDAVERAVREIEASEGPITAILHGAGTNVPQLLSALDEPSFRRTISPKVQGLHNVLSAVNPEKIRLLVAFGSIIARVGLRGEADYAVANEWMARVVDDWGKRHPHCQSLTLEWSVWSGTGMGQRLGRIETLLEQGITPISPDQGVDAFLKVLGSSLPESSVILSGRFGQPPELTRDVELPFRRYVQSVRVHYPGVELIVDATIGAESDPYILDHQYHGQPLFAAVMGLEAMSQVAMSLANWQQPPLLENVRFDRPVTCPATIRIAALLLEDGSVEVVLRSSETGFQADHFRVTCRPARQLDASSKRVDFKLGRLPEIVPQRDLYGGILFQAGRYQRVHRYRMLQARECIVEIDSCETNWFDRYAAPHLELGDPGARDAVIHSIQACIPHRILLPTGVERLTIYSVASCSRMIAHALERSCDGDTFVYDIEVADEDGSLRERWEGLSLRAVEQSERIASLPESLVAVYLERRLIEASPKAAVKISFAANEVSGKRSYRIDGKPDGPMSFSYTGSRQLSLDAGSACGCDAESVLSRPEGDWLNLLGSHRYSLAAEVALHAGETTDTAATRVWCAMECLKKAGLPYDAPLALRTARPQGSVELVSGQTTIVSVATGIRELPEPVMFAFAIQPNTYASNI